MAATLLAAVPPAQAQAGRYHVYSCRTPAGEQAPVDGWTGSVAPAGATYTYATNTCGEGGALLAALGEYAPHAGGVNRATWSFAPPSGESIAGATLWRAGETAGGGNAVSTYEFWLAAPTLASAFDECAVYPRLRRAGRSRRPPVGGESRGPA